MKTLIWIAFGMFSATLLWAEPKKEFPAHWGKPPEIQLRDYVELPNGYGHGSSTLRNWITTNLQTDQAGTGEAKPVATALYANDFEKAVAGAVPDDMMILGGEFTVKSSGTNQFLELPGSPLDSFAVQFGPAVQDSVAVNARVCGTAKGRRAPTFGVGLGGVSGWKLQVSPGKKAVELLKDQELKATVAYDWKSGTWTQLWLEIRKVKDGEWSVEGKVWASSEREPKTPLITVDEKEEPISGKASILGSPFAGTPVWYDDLQVLSVAK
ncbi:MAG: hypothetical protein QM813_21805 [Verrucomicrobiota bacterium]